MKENSRCEWCHGSKLYTDYHDEEWGTPLFDDWMLFEFLVLEGAQAGLSWITILNKRENYRRAFDEFVPEKVARYDEQKVAILLGDAGIVRNKLKLRSAINNAQRMLDLKASGISLSDFIWDVVDGRPIQNKFETKQEVPASTPVSDLLCKKMKHAGFNFVGSTICYALMQATGMVNDHLIRCPRHRECSEHAL
jgi:DNA-3-methyladenine glycosylase I